MHNLVLSHHLLVLIIAFNVSVQSGAIHPLASSHPLIIIHSLVPTDPLIVTK